MSLISDNNKAIFNQFQEDFLFECALFWKRRMFPNRLKIVVKKMAVNKNEITLKQAWDICDALLNHTGHVSLWFFNCLANLYNSSLIGALCTLQRDALFTEENFNAVVIHQYPMRVVEALRILNSAKLLDQGNRDAVAHHQNPCEMATALKRMDLAKIVNKDNHHAVACHKTPLLVADALNILNSAKMLTLSNRDAVVNHHTLLNFVNILSNLNASNILDKDNFNKVLHHKDPWTLASVLNRFQSSNFLNQDNFNVIVTHENLSSIASALSMLIIVGQLTQATFNMLINYIPILFAANSARSWSLIPYHGLANAHVQQIFALCADNTITIAARQQGFIDYVNNIILGLNGDLQININSNQSTHAASVHKSVSESAIKLVNLYREEVSEQQVQINVNKLKQFIKNLPNDTGKNGAAKRCVQRITARDYVFIDKESNVSLRQLLALSWLAINDSNVRIGSLDDARAQLVEGLYEIQRGYNLSEFGVDDGKKDSCICMGGTFNKLIEKLAGVHPMCSINYITKKTATYKLPRVIEEELISYLDARSNPHTVFECLTFVRLLLKIKAGGIRPIWEDIRPRVSRRMFSEFASLYEHDETNKDFVQFINLGGEYYTVTELPDYQKSIHNSEGYQRYCKQMLMTTNQRFFAHNDDRTYSVANGTQSLLNK